METPIHDMMARISSMTDEELAKRKIELEKNAELIEQELFLIRKLG